MTGLGDIDLFDILVLKTQARRLASARCYHPEACRALRPLRRACVMQRTLIDEID